VVGCFFSPLNLCIRLIHFYKREYRTKLGKHIEKVIQEIVETY